MPPKPQAGGKGEALSAISTKGVSDMIAKKIEESTEAGSILGAAARLMGAVTEAPNDDAATDLLAAIRAYYEGAAAFNQNNLVEDAEIQAFAAVTYEPPTKVLQQWSAPACNYEEAIAALRLAAEEFEEGDDSVVEPMMKAALAFFELVPGQFAFNASASSGLSVTDMIAKKIEESNEAGSILGAAAARLMGAAQEARGATHNADTWSAVQAYQADMAEKVGQIYDVFRNAEATLGLSLNTIEKVVEACVGNPIMHDVSNLERVVRLVLSSLSSGLDELSEIETDLCSVELSDRFGLVGGDLETLND